MSLCHGNALSTHLSNRMTSYVECISFCSITGHSASTAVMNGGGAHYHSEEESKQDVGGDTDGGEDSNEQEVIVIQDTGFTVKIQAPGTEPFDLQVQYILRQSNSRSQFATTP